jgi:hypothetical protein
MIIKFPAAGLPKKTGLFRAALLDLALCYESTVFIGNFFCCSIIPFSAFATRKCTMNWHSCVPVSTARTQNFPTFPVSASGVPWCP